jgi:hypothetical protein
MGSVCRVKRFANGSRNSLKDVRKSQMLPGQIRKWLRQQSKDFCAAGFDALVKRWDKCISVAGEYVEKYMFSSGFEYHMFHVLFPFMAYLLPPLLCFCSSITLFLFKTAFPRLEFVSVFCLRNVVF